MADVLENGMCRQDLTKPCVHKCGPISISPDGQRVEIGEGWEFCRVPDGYDADLAIYQALENFFRMHATCRLMEIANEQSKGIAQ